MFVINRYTKNQLKGNEYMDNNITNFIRLKSKKKKYSESYIKYWEKHPYCEICNYYSSSPHHIRTRGAGGNDNHTNLLALCHAHHTEIHTMGVMSFADKYSQFFDKIITALSERDAINIFVTRRQE